MGAGSAVVEYALKLGGAKAAKEILKVAGEDVAWPATVAWVALGVLQAGLDGYTESLLREAATALGKRAGTNSCPHLRALPRYQQNTSGMLNAAFQYKGCAFQYKASCFYHEQDDLNTTGLSTWVLRYDSDIGKVGIYNDWALFPCRMCKKH